MIENILSAVSGMTPYGPLIEMAGGLMSSFLSKSPEEQMRNALKQERAKQEGLKNTNNMVSKPLLRFGGVTKIKGNSHEAGGVDMQTMETEGGETITNDGNFVFSDTLKLGGKSFASLSQSIMNKYKGSKDKLDVDSMQAELEDLAIQQEGMKIKTMRSSIKAPGVDEQGEIIDETAFNQYGDNLKPLMTLGVLNLKKISRFLDGNTFTDEQTVDDTKNKKNKTNDFTISDNLSFAAQFAAPVTGIIKTLSDLNQPKIDFNEIKPQTIVPEEISASSQIEATRNAFAKGADTIAGASVGQGNYMANISQLMMDRARQEAGIIQNVDNQNVGIRNQAQQYNAGERARADSTNLQTTMMEEELNQRTVDNLNTQLINSMSAAGATIAGFNKDKKAEHYDSLERQDKIKLLSELFPNYILNGNETDGQLSFIFNSLTKKKTTP